MLLIIIILVLILVVLVISLVYLNFFKEKNTKNQQVEDYRSNVQEIFYKFTMLGFRIGLRVLKDLEVWLDNLKVDNEERTDHEKPETKAKEEKKETDKK